MTAAHLHDTLLARGETVGCAESLTGGALAAELSATPGASATFVGGVVAYATRIKLDLLGVPADVVGEHGVVSAPCAEAMAAGARRVLRVDWALSTTGVAGPESQDGKPVGRVHVGLAGPEGVLSVRLDLGGDRTTIRATTVEHALDLLQHHLGRVVPRGS